MKWEFLQDLFDTQYERKEVPPYLFSKNKRTKVSKKKEGEYSNSMFHGQIKTFDQDRREKKEKVSILRIGTPFFYFRYYLIR